MLAQVARVWSAARLWLLLLLSSGSAGRWIYKYGSPDMHINYLRCFLLTSFFSPRLLLPPPSPLSHPRLFLCYYSFYLFPLWFSLSLCSSFFLVCLFPPPLSTSTPPHSRRRVWKCPSLAATRLSPRTTSWRWATRGWSLPTPASLWIATPTPSPLTPLTSPSWTPSPPRPWRQERGTPTPTARRPPWPPRVTSAPAGPPTPPQAPVRPPTPARSPPPLQPPPTVACVKLHRQKRPPGVPPSQKEGPRTERLNRKRIRPKVPEASDVQLFIGTRSFPSTTTITSKIHQTQKGSTKCTVSNWKAKKNKKQQQHCTTTTTTTTLQERRTTRVFASGTCMPLKIRH